MPLLLPKGISDVALDREWQYEAPYPPLGFLPVADGQLGNGDTFGLYWPIGHEDREPIVAETWHDSGEIQPIYSSVSTFVTALQATDYEYPDPPEVHEDPRSPRVLLLAAKASLQKQETEAAVRTLEEATSLLPEYTAALSLLWSQYVRQQRKDDAIQIGLRVLRAPPSFGIKNIQLLRWLQAQQGPTELDFDPLWRMRGELKLSYGGAKENGDYAIYKAAIDAYIEAGRYVEASTLMQTYAQLMYRETVSFQERHDFKRAEFIGWQLEISGNLPHGPRILAG
jgi:tetratricopeptide (TPR) repeat protein